MDKPKKKPEREIRKKLPRNVKRKYRPLSMRPLVKELMDEHKSH